MNGMLLPMLGKAGDNKVPNQSRLWIRMYKGKLYSCSTINRVGRSSVSKGLPCNQFGIIAPKYIGAMLTAEDISTTVSGKGLATFSPVEHQELIAIDNWAKSVGSSVKPNKKNLLLLTKKYKLPAWTKPKLGETTLLPKLSNKCLTPTG